ncbi:MAG: cation-transporting P-type ATPase, partial [Lancefieldella rimae]
MAKTRRAIQNQTNRTLDRGDLGALLGFAATHSEQSVCRKARAYTGGLPIDIAQAKLDLNGPNAVSETVEDPTVIRFLKCFASPFTLILLALAAISYITNVVLAPSGEQDPTTVIIIAIMVLISGIIDFVQSSRGASAAAALLQMVTATTRVRRRPINFDDSEVSHTKTPHDGSLTDGASHAATGTADTPDAGSSFDKEIPFADVVVGDLVLLASGDMVPADCRVLDAKDLFVNETALTGESEPVEKFPTVVHARRRADGTRYPLSISECTNLLFAGTTVQSGSATAVVVATGDDT